VNEAPETISEAMLDRRLHLEAGMGYFAPVSAALGVLLLGVFAAQVLGGWLGHEGALLASGAMQGERVVAGEWWRLWSATLLHGSWDHLLSNLFMLYLAGMACEHAFGPGATLGVYAAACGVSSLASATRPAVSVGASGGVFGLLGLLSVMLWVRRDLITIRDPRASWVFGFWALYALVTGAIIPAIDNLGHFGGFVAGAIAALLLTPRLLEEDGRPSQGAWIGPVFALAVFSYAAVHMVPRFREGPPPAPDPIEAER
jgi:rhomboid protease GluP